MNIHLQKMLSLYFVAGTQDCRHLGENADKNLLNVLKQALDGGITCFQFRDKGKFSLQHEPEHQRQLAMVCRDLCHNYHVPFIVNDDVDLALDIGADGIHVGQSDACVTAIRQQCHQSLIIGWSVNTLAQAQQGEKLSEIDYFGIGPIFPTQSKENPKPVVGMAFIETLRQAGIRKPLVAIGGVKLTHIPTLRAYGADGVAVISAISHAHNPYIATQALAQASKGIHHENQ